MVNLKTVKTIHFIGIKGVAMAGLSVICKQRGMAVSGSDVALKFITDDTLHREGITVLESFDPAHLDGQPDLVVVGTSWGTDNVEVAEAKRRGIPIISDAELRGLLSREKKTIAVTGVHGNTTATALLAHLFTRAGLQPSFLVGTGTVPNLGSNARWAAGDYFIVEGDEYSRSHDDPTPKFLDLQPAISIITSIEWEHVDIFPDTQAIEAAFKKLVGVTSDLVVACGDWPSVRKVISGQEQKVATYGLTERNLWQAHDIRQEPDRMVFRVKREGIDIDEFSTNILGRHNVLNALACIIVSLKAGIELETIRDGLQTFSGTQRRFEVTESKGITFVDDYGHHPSEIKATLETVRSWTSATRLASTPLTSPQRISPMQLDKRTQTPPTAAAWSRPSPRSAASSSPTTWLLRWARAMCIRSEISLSRITNDQIPIIKQSPSPNFQ